VWSKKNVAQEKAPNLLKMVEIFNKRSYWIASEILGREHAAERAKVMEKFIRLASKLLKLHNFFSAFAVVSGLTLQPVYRLKSTWNLLSFTAKAKFDKVKLTINSNRNYAAYRRALRAGFGKPQIPHLAVITKDICGIDELKFDHAPDEIPFALYQRQFAEISTLLQCQQYPFHLSRSQLCFLALHACFEENITEERMWQRSYRFDPRPTTEAAQS
jgi:hypothetical protein